MITGYNTDVRHNEVVFHVQTEDKGLGNPCIESLVYVGGQVLGSKRASYADLLAEGRDEKSVMALMDHQHRTMIAAIRHGKFDDKLAEVRGAAAPPAAPPAGAGPVEARAPERSLDQVILEYLTSESDQEQLLLTLHGEAELAPGRRVQLALRAQSSKSGQPVPGTQVSVRMISTIAEPRPLAAGRTDDEGSVALAFDIPALSRGTAALVITAVSPIGRAELKHLL